MASPLPCQLTRTGLLVLLTLTSGAQGSEALDARAIPPLVEAPVREPLHPALFVLTVPLSLVAPGTGHLLRGETQTGGRMLVSAGVLLASALGLSSATALAGASEYVTGPVVPLLLLGVGGYLTLGVADAVGTFTRAGDPGPALEPWTARRRVRAGYLYAPYPATSQAHAATLLFEEHPGRFYLQAEALLSKGGGPSAAGAGVGYHLLDLPHPSPGDGLRLDLSFRNQWHPGFQVVRTRAVATMTTPLGVLLPTLGRVTSIFRLGIQPTWTRYSSGARDFSAYWTGGFEARVAALDFFFPYLGYEHAPEALWGGRGFGAVGFFYAGAELALGAGFWLDVRGHLSTPLSGALSLERRW